MLLRVPGAPLGVGRFAENPGEFLLLTGVVLFELFEVDFCVLHGGTAALAVGAHAGTSAGTVTAWTATSGTHSTSGTALAGTSAVVHVTAAPTGAGAAFGTGAGSASLKVVSAILNVFLVEPGEFLDLPCGKRKFCGHFVHVHLGFLFYGELGPRAMVLSGLMAGRLCCGTHADGETGSDESDSVHGFIGLTSASITKYWAKGRAGTVSERPERGAFWTPSAPRLACPERLRAQDCIFRARLACPERLRARICVFRARAACSEYLRAQICVFRARAACSEYLRARICVFLARVACPAEECYPNYDPKPVRLHPRCSYPYRRMQG